MSSDKINKYELIGKVFTRGRHIQYKFIDRPACNSSVNGERIYIVCLTGANRRMESVHTMTTVRNSFISGSWSFVKEQNGTSVSTENKSQMKYEGIKIVSANTIALDLFNDFSSGGWIPEDFEHLRDKTVKEWLESKGLRKWKAPSIRQIVQNISLEESAKSKSKFIKQAWVNTKEVRAHLDSLRYKCEYSSVLDGYLWTYENGSYIATCTKPQNSRGQP